MLEVVISCLKVIKPSNIKEDLSYYNEKSAPGFMLLLTDLMKNKDDINTLIKKNNWLFKTLLYSISSKTIEIRVCGIMFYLCCICKAKYSSVLFENYPNWISIVADLSKENDFFTKNYAILCIRALLTNVYNDYSFVNKATIKQLTVLAHVDDYISRMVVFKIINTRLEVGLTPLINMVETPLRKGIISYKSEGVLGVKSWKKCYGILTCDNMLYLYKEKSEELKMKIYLYGCKYSNPLCDDPVITITRDNLSTELKGLDKESTIEWGLVLLIFIL